LQVQLANRYKRKLVHTHHFTDDDETNCKVVFKVKSKGALFPGMLILEGHISEDFTAASPTCTFGTLSPDTTEASRAPNPLSAFSYQWIRNVS
jgi:hypothetical protein